MNAENLNVNADLSYSSIAELNYTHIGIWNLGLLSELRFKPIRRSHGRVHDMSDGWGVLMNFVNHHSPGQDN